MACAQMRVRAPRRLQAAEVLGLRQLHEYCQARLGKLSGLRLWRYPEISEANASGHVLLILDGMCLDATAWLPQHPGGRRRVLG